MSSCSCSAQFFPCKSRFKHYLIYLWYKLIRSEHKITTSQPTEAARWAKKMVDFTLLFNVKSGEKGCIVFHSLYPTTKQRKGEMHNEMVEMSAKECGEIVDKTVENNGLCTYC